jgi:hypothetical protein
MNESDKHFLLWNLNKESGSFSAMSGRTKQPSFYLYGFVLKEYFILQLFSHTRCIMYCYIK